MRSLASHYADALVDVALEQNAADATRRELGEFLDLLGESPDLNILLNSPAVSRGNKHAMVEALVNRIGAGRTIRNFLFVVVDRRRTALLQEIQLAFDEALDERQGIARAHVATARELTSEEKGELVAAIERLTGRKIQAEYRIHPDLIAGAVVRVGSTIYNGSVRAQLERLRIQLATN